jgi:CheY-like chemotaxis protein
LKNEGHGVIVVNDGREAIRILKSDCDFDAAIFGVRMPHLDGTEVIRHMRTEKRLMRIPVILITSEQSFTLMNDSFAAGATAFLSKPLVPGQVQILVRMLLSQSSGIKGHHFRLTRPSPGTGQHQFQK